MTDYDARGQELLKAFDDMQTRLQPIELVRCLPIVKDALAQRAQILAAMAAVLVPDGTPPVAPEFNTKQQAITDRFIVPFSNLLSGLDNPTPELDHWRELAAITEARFFNGIKSLNLGEAHDEMFGLHLALLDLITNLTQKWSTLSEDAQRLEKLELDATEAMTQVVSDALVKSTDQWARYGNNLLELLGNFQKVPDLVNEAIVYLATEFGVPEAVAKLIPKISLVGKDSFELAKQTGIPAGDFAKAEPWLARDPGMAVSASIQKYLGPNVEAFVTGVNALHKYVLPIATGAYYEQLGALQRLLPNHGAILVSFSQTRKDVTDFLAKSGMDRLRQLYDRVTLALDQWVSSANTDAQKTDAQQFATTVKSFFSTLFERTTHEFEEFVRANSGRFIGSVDHATEEALLWEDIWVSKEDALAHLGMYDRLKEYLAGTTTVNGTLDSAASQVFQALRALPAEVQDKITPKLNAYLDTVRAQVNQSVDQANQTMRAAQSKVGDDQIKSDLDRAGLADQLKRD